MINGLTPAERDEVIRIAGQYDKVDASQTSGLFYLCGCILKIAIYCFVQVAKEGTK